MDPPKEVPQPRQIPSSCFSPSVSRSSLRHIPRLRHSRYPTMAAPSGQTTQRLVRELKDYAKSPNEALLHLGPVNDENMLQWEAVLKGVNGSPYEGMH